MSDTREKGFNWKGFGIILFILVIIVIVFYRLSGGKSPKINKLKSTFKVNREELQQKHDFLVHRLNENLKLKAKLERLIRTAYFAFRHLIILIWGLLVLILHQEGYLNNLSDLLNYSNSVVIIILIGNYLLFGSLKSLHDFNELIKMRIETWIYSDYIHIHKDIEMLTQKELSVREAIQILDDSNKSQD